MDPKNSLTEEEKSDNLLPTGTNDTNWWISDSKPVTVFSCECGVDSVGQGKHSDWCPKHKKDGL